MRRYRHKHESIVPLVESPEGEYVKAADALGEIEKLKAQLRELRQLAIAWGDAEYRFFHFNVHEMPELKDISIPGSASYTKWKELATDCAAAITAMCEWLKRYDSEFAKRMEWRQR